MKNYINSFIQSKILENLSKSTINSYQFDLNKFKDFCELRNHTLNQGFTQYIEFLEETADYRPNTKIRKLVTLKMFHTYLSDNGVIIPPLPKVRIRKEKRLPKTLNRSEIKKLVQMTSKEKKA